mmetsp:Transcript_3845/g.4460  ORF Transcript_3845/g.4460 Transcript_3845/m.4460 type:complete len:84 (+) Transcript_3845:891-1142(+)
MQAGERFFKEVQISLFLLLLYVALYVIMALLVWFDKKDGKGRWGRSPADPASASGYDGGTDSSEGGPKSFMENFLDSIAAEWP